MARGWGEPGMGIGCSQGQALDSHSSQPSFSGGWLPGTLSESNLIFQAGNNQKIGLGYSNSLHRYSLYNQLC
jgi:hypothetical protein